MGGWVRIELNCSLILIHVGVCEFCESGGGGGNAAVEVSIDGYQGRAEARMFRKV